MARGLRNNNPGNLVIGTGAFEGEIKPSQDKVFRQFKTMAHGYRALFVQMGLFLDKGIDTIEKIITTYAPPHENSTEAYIAQVSRATGILRSRKLEKNDGKDFIKIVSAISHVENGIPAIESDVRAGFALQEVIKL